MRTNLVDVIIRSLKRLRRTARPPITIARSRRKAWSATQRCSVLRSWVQGMMGHSSTCRPEDRRCTERIIH